MKHVTYFVEVLYTYSDWLTELSTTVASATFAGQGRPLPSRDCPQSPYPTYVADKVYAADVKSASSAAAKQRLAH